MASSIPDNSNYMLSSNYSYLMIVICLHKVIWFQLSNNNDKIKKIIIIPQKIEKTTRKQIIWKKSNQKDKGGVLVV